MSGQFNAKPFPTEELRMAFLNYGGGSIYQGIHGSYAVEKKYCAAYDYLVMMSLNGVTLSPMPPHPGTLMQITQDDLADIEASLGIVMSVFQNSLCCVAKAAFCC